ncbi:hypothetical protein SARC_16998, partial [Sphaeroforma arctica JP610]
MESSAQKHLRKLYSKVGGTPTCGRPLQASGVVAGSPTNSALRHSNTPTAVQALSKRIARKAYALEGSNAAARALIVEKHLCKDSNVTHRHSDTIASRVHEEKERLPCKNTSHEAHAQPNSDGVDVQPRPHTPSCTIPSMHGTNLDSIASRAPAEKSLHTCTCNHKPCDTLSCHGDRSTEPSEASSKPPFSRSSGHTDQPTTGSTHSSSSASDSDDTDYGVNPHGRSPGGYYSWHSWT